MRIDRCNPHYSVQRAEIYWILTLNWRTGVLFLTVNSQIELVSQSKRLHPVYFFSIFIRNYRIKMIAQCFWLSCPVVEAGGCKWVLCSAKLPSATSHMGVQCACVWTGAKSESQIQRAFNINCDLTDHAIVYWVFKFWWIRHGMGKTVKQTTDIHCKNAHLKLHSTMRQIAFSIVDQSKMTSVRFGTGTAAHMHYAYPTSSQNYYSAVYNFASFH